MFSAVDVASEAAQWALNQYFSELDRRFSSGFAVDEALHQARQSFNPPAGLFVVAMLGDDVVGCGGIQWMDHDTGEVKRMWVSSQSRGLGLGKRLLAHLEDEVRRSGRRRVVLDTNESLTEAISMYRSLGYVAIERYNDNPYAHHWFEKQVNAE